MFNTITIGVTGLGAWILGRADCARERIARAVAFAQDSKRPYDLAMALLFKAPLTQVSERTTAGRGRRHSTVILIRRTWFYKLHITPVLGWTMLLKHLGSAGGF
jgi:hypothetical protein